MMPDAPVGIVAGTGFDLRPLLDQQSGEVAFDQIAGLKPTAVQGHAGRFSQGRCGPARIVLQSGRLHFYEGHDYETVARPLSVLQSMGVRTVLFTNAAGGLGPGVKPGTLMAVTGLALWPCARWPGHPESVAVDAVLPACDAQGRYIWVHGPCYETPAEIQALRAMDGAAVGMSTAPEVVACQALGMAAVVVSCITNNCLRPQVLTHQHVVETAERSSARLCELIRASLPELRTI